VSCLDVLTFSKIVSVPLSAPARDGSFNRCKIAWKQVFELWQGLCREFSCNLGDLFFFRHHFETCFWPRGQRGQNGLSADLSDSITMPERQSPALASRSIVNSRPGRTSGRRVLIMDLWNGPCRPRFQVPPPQKTRALRSFGSTDNRNRTHFHDSHAIRDQQISSLQCRPDHPTLDCGWEPCFLMNAEYTRAFFQAVSERTWPRGPF